MAKGMYSFVAYPESNDITHICEVLAGAGAEYAYILHDKDTYDSDKTDPDGTVHKAGDLKKPHWHILAGWRKGFPDWKKFKTEIIPELGSVVAPSKSKCLVKDCQGAYDYLTHRNGKS